MSKIATFSISKGPTVLFALNVLFGLYVLFGLSQVGAAASTVAENTDRQVQTKNCVAVDAIDDWRAYDDDTLSVYGEGRELARIDIPTVGYTDTWIMHLIHVARFEGGEDGLLCPRGSDTLVLDGRRHFIEKITLIDPEPRTPAE